MSITLGSGSSVEVFVSPSGEVQRLNAATTAYLAEHTEPQSRAIGMREMDLTPEAAIAITRMLDNTAMQTHKGTALPTGDPSLLRARVY